MNRSITLMQSKPHKRQLTRFAYTALVGVLCPSIAHAQLLPNQALTVDSITGSLYVIDESGAILSEVFAGFGALDVAVTPDGTTAVVTLFGDRQLLRFDLTSPPTLSAPPLGVELLAEDVDVACTPTGFALITDGGGSTKVVSVDITTTPMTLVQNLFLPFDAEAVEVTPDGSLAVVASTFANKVQFVQISPTGTLALIPPPFDFATGDGPINVGISPNGNIALVPNVFDGTVSVLNLSTLSLVGSINLAPLELFGNQSVVFSPDGSTAYVYDASEMGSATVSVLAIDASDNVTDTDIRITGLGGNFEPLFGVDQLAITPNGADLYVRSGFGLEVVDVSTTPITIKTADLMPGNPSGGGVATLCSATNPAGGGDEENDDGGDDDGGDDDGGDDGGDDDGGDDDGGDDDGDG